MTLLGGPFPKLAGRIVGRLEVDEFLVELHDGRRLTCGWTDELKGSRLEMAVGDVVGLAEVEPGKGVIFFRNPRTLPSASAPARNYRERLIAEGLLRPAGR